MNEICYIVSLQYLDIEDAAVLDRVPGYGVILPDNLRLHPFPLCGLAAMTVEAEGTGGEMTYKTVISGRRSGAAPATRRPLAFVATAADGRRLLIGASLRPAPVLHCGSSWADDPASASSDNFEITLTDIHPPSAAL